MRNAKKTIIVTGGAGFIGGNFVHYMLRTHPDYRIICLDCLTYAGNLETLASVMTNPNFRFVKESISDRKAVYDLFEAEHPDLVINFAAESHVDRSIENPSIFLETNVMGTQVLLDACRKYGNIRYHQVSTDEVYGDLPLDRPDLFFTENSPIHTSSPYSASKAAADLLTQAYHRTYDLPVTISRCSNNYGPYHFPEKLIPLMIANALNDKPLPVYGEGINVRDWLYVEDHCRATTATSVRSTTWAATTRCATSTLSSSSARRWISRNPSSSTWLTGRDTICATPSTPLRFTTSWAGSRRPNSPMASPRPSNGTWPTAPGGSTSSPATTRTTIRRCTANGFKTRHRNKINRLSSDSEDRRFSLRLQNQANDGILYMALPITVGG